jgi:hypothetical protein
MQMRTGSQTTSPEGRQSATPIMARRSDYIVVDDGAETRAYRVPSTDASVGAYDRRTAGRHERRTLDGHDRRERIRRALDRMQATPDEIWRIAGAPGAPRDTPTD